MQFLRIYPFFQTAKEFLKIYDLTKSETEKGLLVCYLFLLRWSKEFCFCVSFRNATVVVPSDMAIYYV